MHGPSLFEEVGNKNTDRGGYPGSKNVAGFEAGGS